MKKTFEKIEEKIKKFLLFLNVYAILSLLFTVSAKEVNEDEREYPSKV